MTINCYNVKHNYPKSVVLESSAQRSLGCQTGLADDSRTTLFILGLPVLIGVRMPGSRQL